MNAVRATGLLAAVTTLGWEVTALRRLQNQVGRLTDQWMRHNQATLDQISGDDFVIVALGDSSVQGVGATSIDTGMVPVLASAIRNALGSQVWVVNLSVSGAKAAGVTKQIAAMKGWGIESADLVVVEIGGNDVANAGVTASGFESAMTRVMGELPQGTLVGNIPSFGFLPADDKAAEFSAIVDGQAQRYCLPVVDLRSFSQELGIAEYIFRYHAADAFHPNSRAYREWARLYFDAWAQREGKSGVPFRPGTFEILG